MMRSAALRKEVHPGSRLLARPDWCFLANKRSDLATIFQGGKLLHDGVLSLYSDHDEIGSIATRV